MAGSASSAAAATASIRTPANNSVPVCCSGTLIVLGLNVVAHVFAWLLCGWLSWALVVCANAALWWLWLAYERTLIAPSARRAALMRARMATVAANPHKSHASVQTSSAAAAAAAAAATANTSHTR